MTVNQISNQAWQPIILTFRQAVFDRKVLALHISCFGKPTSKSGQQRSEGCS
jgi:hypothetical protein